MIGNPLSNIPVVVKNLIIINVLVYLAQITMPNIGFNITEYFSLFFWRSELFKPHQLVTSMFLHSPVDFTHLFFNMFGLYIFGRVLESVTGSKKFLIYYVLTGIGAGLISMITKEVQFQLLIKDLSAQAIEYLYNDGIALINGGKGPAEYTQDYTFVKALYLLNSSALGASGAIFGILVAFGYLFPHAKLMLLFPPIPIKGKYIAVVALIMGIVLDVQGNVAHFAHFGGMLTGYILLKAWNTKANSFRL